MTIQRSDEELEQIVRNFLRKIGLEHVQRPEMMTLIVKCKRHFPGFGYLRKPDASMQDQEAIWDSRSMILTMRESIFRGMKRGETHARKIVAHELAHFIAGHEGVHNRNVGVSIEDWASDVLFHESEAIRCSRILLAPEHLIPENSTAQEICEEFGLDIETAVLRKREIDKMRHERAPRDRPLPKKVRNFLLDAQSRGRKVRTKLDDTD